MKTIKIFLILFVAVSFVGVNAQDTVKQQAKDSLKVDSSPKVDLPLKVDYLPKAGNFAIGADATPIFDYIGNMFNNSVGNTLNLSNPMIYFKCYLTDMSAIRAVLGVNGSLTKEENYVRDDAAWYANPLSNAQAVDVKTTNLNDYFLSFAVQKFVGKNRLRGFFGYQLLGEYASTKSVYAYGNPMTGLNPIPSSFYSSGLTERPLEAVTAQAFKVGVGGIAGFEYFVLPRLCVGGEVSLNLIYTQALQTYSKSEKMVSDKLVTVDKANSPGGNQFSLETVSFSPGHVQHLGFYVMFHF